VAGDRQLTNYGRVANAIARVERLTKRPHPIVKIQCLSPTHDRQSALRVELRKPELNRAAHSAVTR
jgi:hypothetical protein